MPVICGLILAVPQEIVFAVMVNKTLVTFFASFCAGIFTYTKLMQ
jgi:hypothetical protein